MPYLPGNFYQPSYEETRDADVDPYGNYYFALEIVEGGSSGSTTEVAHFMECSGLKNSCTVFEIEEGGLNGRTHKRPGQSKWENIKLMYATSASTYLLAWRDQFLMDNFHKRLEFSGHITLKDNHGNVVRRYSFEKAWPVSWEGPTLNGNSSELAIETLEIAHDGLTISGAEDGRPAPEYYAAELEATAERIDPNRFRTDFVEPSWLGQGEFDALRDGTNPNSRGSEPFDPNRYVGVYEEQGESDQAVTRYNNAGEAAPDHRRDTTEIGDRFESAGVEAQEIAHGDSDEAVTVYENAGEAAPDHQRDTTEIDDRYESAGVAEEVIAHGDSDDAVTVYGNAGAGPAPDHRRDRTAGPDRFASAGVEAGVAEHGESDDAVNIYTGGAGVRPDDGRFGDDGLIPVSHGSEGYDPNRHKADNYSAFHDSSSSAITDYGAALLDAIADAVGAGGGDAEDDVDDES